jgi:alpha-beta hydrolase superfamily lysophospholipase
LGVTAKRFSALVGVDPVIGVFHPAPVRPAPCVIACHGMGASKDSDKYLLLARTLPAWGLSLARFDFRGSGESGAIHVGATVESRVADLLAVVEHLAKQPEVDGRFAFLGSSLGGFVALWAAADRALTCPTPLPVVTWNAPASLPELGATVKLADPHGPGPALVAEVRRGRYAQAPAGVRHHLVVQADRDEVVPPGHGDRLVERAADPKALHVIAGADHRLSDPGHRWEAVERSGAWLARHFMAGAR